MSKIIKMLSNWLCRILINLEKNVSYRRGNNSQSNLHISNWHVSRTECGWTVLAC